MSGIEVKKVPLGEVAAYINGKAFKPEQWAREGLPIIRIENLNNPNADYNYFDGELEERYKVQDGDLLVSWSASLDAFIWNRGDAALNQHIFKVDENAELVDRRYLFYVLKEVMQEIRDQTYGATMKHINKPEFEAFEIPLPPLPEQKRIAAILTERLAAVEQAQTASLARLEAARALPAAYLREVFESEEAKEWKKTPLLSVCHGKGQYGTSNKSNGLGQGKPVLGMKHIQNGRLVFDDLSHVELPSREEEKYVLERGDLIFNRTNSAELVGKTAVFESDEKMVFASYLIRFKLRKDEADPRFISAYINSRQGRKFVEANMARAIGQVNISASTMHDMLVPLPPIASQRKFMDEYAMRLEHIDQLERGLRDENSDIDALPASLLRQAFSGAL